MSKQKQPMAGEWWTLGDLRVYVIGKAIENNEYAVQEEDLEVHGRPLSGWAHLPECTGWGWQPNKAPREFDVSPGDGWRWLEDNEWICSEDEYFAMDVGQFFKVSDSVGELASLLRKLGCPARRRIPTTRTIKLCSVVYWDRPEAPMSTILTEQELERHRKAWRTMHVVSETTVEVPL